VLKKRKINFLVFYIYSNQNPVSCVLKASKVECRLIPSINTPATSRAILSQHWIDTWLTLDRHSINIWLTVGDSWRSVNWLMCIDQHLMGCLQKLVKCTPTVDRDVNWVLTEYRRRWWSSVDRDVDQVSIKSWLYVWIDTWAQMPLVHMVQISY